MSEEILGNVAEVELPRKKWTITFDGLVTTTLNGKKGLHDVSL